MGRFASKEANLAEATDDKDGGLVIREGRNIRVELFHRSLRRCGNLEEYY